MLSTGRMQGRQNHLRASAGFEGGLDFQPLGASSARLSSATGKLTLLQSHSHFWQPHARP